VLKIRPPLTFEPQHADRLLDALDQALQTKT
jgi:4-aminobutyrate aminotransferase-like enzyme